MARLRLSVQLDGYRELKRKMRTDELLAEPWREALESAAVYAHQEAQAAAPVRTGKLQASIGWKMSARPLPFWAKVETKARAPKRFNYPALLNFSPKHGHKGWLTDMRNRIQGNINAILERAAKEIERLWQA